MFCIIIHVPACILPNNLITLRGSHLIFIKTGWQKSTDEASTYFMIKAGVTLSN